MIEEREGSFFFFVFTRRKRPPPQNVSAGVGACDYEAIEVDKTALSVGGGMWHQEPRVELSANFTLVPAHRALCLYSFEVRTHLKRRQSSRARAERSD